MDKTPPASNPSETHDAPLTPAQLAELQRLLDAREAVLRDEVRAAKDARENRPAALGPQVGDAGEAGEERSRLGVEHAELLRDQEELVAIEGARGRLRDGSYGECVDCGRAIPFARLQAQPAAARCVDCQSAWERTHATTPRYDT